MISVEEARARILAPLRATGPETVPLTDAWNRVLAHPVLARRTQPPADLSAMDGYAVRAEDSGQGARLRVVGTAAAGQPFVGRLNAGQAVRVFTGSVVPDGADAVVIQEDTDRDGDTLFIRDAARPGRHIRSTGADFRSGEPVLQPGRVLGARAIGLAAAADHPWLTVHRRPRIAILSTGDELAMPGEPVPAGGIIGSNALSMAALVRAGGGEPILLPVAGDTLPAITGAVEQLGDIDMLLTTGGASVGDRDLVRAALEHRGFTLDFWKIAMRPGKPLIHGSMGAVPVLGLPGNPVSALVCSLLFLVPALHILSGRPDPGVRTEPARLGGDLRANDHRADFLRARLNAAGIVTPYPVQDSSMLRILAESDCLILRSPQAPAMAIGETVAIMRLDRNGF